MVARYLAVAGLAAAPWGEEVLAIPAGVALGLPVWQAAPLALLANIVPVVVIGILFGRLGLAERWNPDRSPRGRRAAELFRKYGLAGMALLAPVATGVYIATVAVLVLGVPLRTWLGWVVVSLAGWAAVTAALVQTGSNLLQLL